MSSESKNKVIPVDISKTTLKSDGTSKPKSKCKESSSIKNAQKPTENIKEKESLVESQLQARRKKLEEDEQRMKQIRQEYIEKIKNTGISESSATSTSQDTSDSSKAQEKSSQTQNKETIVQSKRS